MMRYMAFISLAIMALSACSTIPLPTIDRVQRVPEYIVIPDEILGQCPPIPEVSQEVRSDIKSETDYNEMFVLPLWEALNMCKSTVEAVKKINEDAKQRNISNGEGDDSGKS